MKYKFQFIGDPFSEENPGVICEFDVWDVAEMRRSYQWREVISENPQENAPSDLQPKVLKILGVPKITEEKRGPGRPRKDA